MALPIAVPCSGAYPERSTRSAGKTHLRAAGQSGRSQRAPIESKHRVAQIKACQWWNSKRQKDCADADFVPSVP